MWLFSGHTVKFPHKVFSVVYFYANQLMKSSAVNDYHQPTKTYWKYTTKNCLIVVNVR